MVITLSDFVIQYTELIPDKPAPMITTSATDGNSSVVLWDNSAIISWSENQKDWVISYFPHENFLLRRRRREVPEKGEGKLKEKLPRGVQKYLVAFLPGIQHVKNETGFGGKPSRGTFVRGIPRDKSEPAGT